MGSPPPKSPLEESGPTGLTCLISPPAEHQRQSGTLSLEVPQDSSTAVQPSTLVCNDGTNSPPEAAGPTSHLSPPPKERASQSENISATLQQTASTPDMVSSDMETSDLDGVPLPSAATSPVESLQTSLVKMLFPATVKKKKPAPSVPVASQQRGRKVWNVDEFAALRPPTKKGFTASGVASSSKGPKKAQSSRLKPPTHPHRVSTTSTSHVDKPSGLPSQVLSRTNSGMALTSSGQKKSQSLRHSTASVSKTPPSATSHIESPLVLPADASPITLHVDAPLSLPSPALSNSRRPSGQKDLQARRRSTATPPSRVDIPPVLPTGDLSERNNVLKAPPRMPPPPDIPAAPVRPAVPNLAPTRPRRKPRRRRDVERPPYDLDRTGFRSREDYDASSDSEWSTSSSDSDVSALDTAPTSAAPTPSLYKYLIAPQDLCFPTFETAIPDRVTQQGVINAMFEGFICAKCRRANYRQHWGSPMCSNCGVSTRFGQLHRIGLTKCIRIRALSNNLNGISRR